MVTFQFSSSDFFDKLGVFCADESAQKDVRESVASILQEVKAHGDSAVLELTEKFDRAKLTTETMRVSAQELADSVGTLTATQRKAIEQAIHCVRDFHEKSIPQSWEGKNPHGAIVGERYYPLERVGIWIPGGSVPLVSTVVMTVTLAKIAGVPSIAVFTPPRPDGTVNPGLLAALKMSGVEEVYRVGGVLAVGAMAFGTETIPPVVKAYGPGNAYVMEAKRQVLGTIGIDLLPGPSEIMVIADDSANPVYVAADLLAQAEHGSGKEKIYFVTTSEALVEKVEAEIKRQAPELSHADKIATVLEKGGVTVLVEALEQAWEVANFVAPEHLELHIDEARFDEAMREITTAGAILLGGETPTVLGDFTAGPSHTLPTNRAGRFFSGLKMSDFYRRSSYVRYDKESLKPALEVVRVFSELEQLDGHGMSLERRFH